MRALYASDRPFLQRLAPEIRPSTACFFDDEKSQLIRRSRHHRRRVPATEAIASYRRQYSSSGRKHATVIFRQMPAVIRASTKKLCWRRGLLTPFTHAHRATVKLQALKGPRDFSPISLLPAEILPAGSRNPSMLGQNCLLLLADEEKSATLQADIMSMSAFGKLGE